jgi:3-oxoacyl-[acyl-carrier protein] reductase
MPVSIDLSGRLALVTGASRGIGAAIARALHAAGSTVALNHPDQGDGETRRDAEGLARELEQVRAGSTLVEAADMSNAGGVRAMFERVRSRFGGLDILVNNAGILRDRTIAKMTLEEWSSVIDVNLTGVFHGCKFGLEVMRDGGSIVNLGSLAAKAGFHGQSNYAAAKAGVQAMTMVLAREVGRRGIRVNAVAPGVIDTPMMAQVAQDVRGRMTKAVPLGRLGRPDEVASAVLFLVSDLASYVSGTTLEVNGGWHG